MFMYCFRFGLAITLFMTAFLSACASGHCRIRQAEAASQEAAMTEAEAPRVWVYKYDGSKQCEEGEIKLEIMQEELAGIEVFAAEKRHDGLMRPAVCGADTGEANVFEIRRDDLAKALEKGFKEWVF